MEVGAPEFRIAEPFKGFVLTPQVFSTSHLVLGPVAQPLRLLEYSTEGGKQQQNNPVRGVTTRQGEGPCRSTKALPEHGEIRLKQFALLRLIRQNAVKRSELELPDKMEGTTLYQLYSNMDAVKGPRGAGT
jgi:hypothetical protein